MVDPSSKAGEASGDPHGHHHREAIQLCSEGVRMRNPPILVSVIGFFGAIAGFYWLYLGLRLLGFDWFGA